MTTIPGHNNILPQSKIVQEVNEQTYGSKPSPDQAAAIQRAQQEIQNTSVQSSQASEKLNKEKEKQKARRKAAAEKRKKKRQQEELALDPEATGRLLDTTA